MARLPDKILPLCRRRHGLTLIEVMVAISIVTVSLMSIATATFDLLRSGKATHKDYVANSIVAERLIELRQEFDSATGYLDAYGAPGTEFDPTSVSPASDEILGETAVVGRVTAVPYAPGPANALILTVELEYGTADGAPRTAALVSFMRCDNP